MTGGRKPSYLLFGGAAILGGALIAVSVGWLEDRALRRYYQPLSDVRLGSSLDAAKERLGGPELATASIVEHVRRASFSSEDGELKFAERYYHWRGFKIDVVLGVNGGDLVVYRLVGRPDPVQLPGS